ncbi:MAG: hypothetical protein WDZ26_06800 [Nitriliruptoraceae bacterium]
MHTHRTHSLRTTLTAVLAAAVLVAGCADDTPDPQPDDAPGAAGGTTMHVLTVPDAKTNDDEGSLFVVGMLIDDGSGWRLCESVLESHPPQCGGEFLVVEGLDDTGLPLEEASGVRWQVDATVVGEIDGDVLTVTGSPASS